MRGEYWHVSLLVCGFAIPVSSSALAQTTAATKWEVEFHGGGLLPANPSSGTVSLPGPGEAFITALVNPTPPPPSRRESSWYFGDGAVLFNDAATSLGRLPNHILALDSVLARSLGEYRRGGSFGVRVSRDITRRFGAELSVDYGLASRRITASNATAIEATRASFVPAWSGLITFNPFRVLNSVTSTATLTPGSGRQLFTSGVLNVNLGSSGAILPYLSIGGGLISIIGQRSSATLRGNYQFLLPSGAPIDETDNVTVRDDYNRHSLAGVVGVGMKYYASRRWGLRLDARVAVSRAVANTSLDATPNVALGLLPVGRGALGATPSIQWTNNSTDVVTALGVTAVAASSLTGPALTRYRTFAGSGAQTHASVTVGWFWRF